MNYKNIELNKDSTKSLKETLKLRGDNMSLYALKLIESFENTEDNPIKDNRFVSDLTFAKRLQSHLKDVRAECQMGQEELEYLTGVADKLFDYQKKTMPEDEKWFFKNIQKNLQ